MAGGLFEERRPLPDPITAFADGVKFIIDLMRLAGLSKQQSSRSSAIASALAPHPADVQSH